MSVKAIFDDDSEDNLLREDVEAIGYTHDGNNVVKYYDVSKTDCIAKELHIKTRRVKEIRYFIKVDEMSNPFNPWQDRNRLSRDDFERNDKALWSWAEVQSATFRSYIRFLLTQNELYIDSVARLIKDGQA